MDWQYDRKFPCNSSIEKHFPLGAFIMSLLVKINEGGFNRCWVGRYLKYISNLLATSWRVNLIHFQLLHLYDEIEGPRHETPTQLFCCEFYEFCKKTFYRTLLVAAFIRSITKYFKRGFWKGSVWKFVKNREIIYP